MSRTVMYVSEKQAIAQRYIDGNASLEELVKETGESEDIIFSWVIKHCRESGIPVPERPVKTVVTLSKKHSSSMEQAIYLVTADGYTTRQAAKKLGVSQKALEDNLKSYFEEVKEEMSEQKAIPRKKIKNFSARFKKKVAKARLIDGLSLKETADKFNVGLSSVSRWVNQYRDIVFKEEGIPQDGIFEEEDLPTESELSNTPTPDSQVNDTSDASSEIPVDNLTNTLVTYLQAEIQRLKAENAKLRQALTIIINT